MQEKKMALATKHFKEWLKTRKMTIQYLCEELSTPYQVVWGWLNGQGRPNVDNAVKIEELTDRSVTCKDWTTYLSKKAAAGKKGDKKDEDKPKRNRNTRAKNRTLD